MKKVDVIRNTKNVSVTRTEEKPPQECCDGKNKFIFGIGLLSRLRF